MRKREYVSGFLTWVSCVLCVLVLAGCRQYDRAFVLDVHGSNEQDGHESEVQSEHESGALAESGEKKAAEDAGEAFTQSGVQTVAEPKVLVHVCGAVVSPGVVELAEGSRVWDALQEAGGLLEEAATDYINLAAVVADGQQLYFPTREEVEESAETPLNRNTGEQAQDGGRVNINTANKELLCTLPGIGEARAEAIMEYREQHGAFATIEDIMQVAGIKQSAYEKLCDHITVR